MPSTPCVRRRGEDRWRPVSWDDALGRVPSAIFAFGRERVGFWFGHGAHVANIVRPGTVWLEDLGIKETATHHYLMDKGLEPAGECGPLVPVVRELAERLSIKDSRLSHV